MASSENIPKHTLRIIDANLNRVGEGLRFLEELARLVLNDTYLTQQLKTMRHEIVKSELPFQQQLLQARDSEGDVGADMEVPGEEKRKDLTATAVANAGSMNAAIHRPAESRQAGFRVARPPRSTTAPPTRRNASYLLSFVPGRSMD